MGPADLGGPILRRHNTANANRKTRCALVTDRSGGLLQTFLFRTDNVAICEKCPRQGLTGTEIDHLENHAVHPGQIDLQDKPDTAESLFLLVNLVVDVMISRKSQIAELFEALPQSERTKIARRDNNANA